LSPKLWERALQDNISYEELLKLGIAKLGIAKEQSAKGAALLEKVLFLRKQVAKLNQQKIPKKKLDIRARPAPKKVIHHIC